MIIDKCDFCGKEYHPRIGGVCCGNKECQKQYRKSDKYKQHRKQYMKQYMKQYRESDKYKQHKKQYDRQRYLKNKAKRLARQRK